MIAWYVFPPTGGMLTNSEMSLVMTEIHKMDPTFDRDEFVRWCRDFVIPNILEVHTLCHT